MGSAGERFDECRDPLRQIFGIADLADVTDDGAADDHRVRLASDFPGLFGSGNSEADGNGEAGMPADLCDLCGDGL